MHEEPWSFAVIQDRDLLNRLSDSTKGAQRGARFRFAPRKAFLDLMNKPDFHVFYNTGTLIINYSKFQGPFVVADCWLAAESREAP
jgi:nitroreductase